LNHLPKNGFAQPFDLKRFAVTGEPTIIMADVQFMPQVKKALFAVSDGAGEATFAHRTGKDAAPGDTQAMELKIHFFFGGRYLFSIEATIT
jgi:hypothetical protein